MDLHVLLEKVNETLYRASALTLSAEGATEDEALAKLKGQFLQRMATGAKVVTMPVPEPPHWMKHLSKLPLDHPVVQDYLAELAEIRRKADEEENPIRAWTSSTATS